MSVQMIAPCNLWFRMSATGTERYPTHLWTLQETLTAAPAEAAHELGY